MAGEVSQTHAHALRGITSNLEGELKQGRCQPPTCGGRGKTVYSDLTRLRHPLLTQERETPRLPYLPYKPYKPYKP